MGFVDQLNWDRSGDAVLLEYSRHQVLKHHCISQNAHWMILVSPGRAVVALNTKPVTMESLTTFVNGIKEMNKLEKRKVNEGGLYINRVVLSKHIANIPDVKPHVTADGRTFYDRHQEKMKSGGKEWTNNKAIVLESHTEVMAQLSGFHYLENKEYMLQILDGTIRTFLINKAKEQNVANEEMHGEILHFYCTTNPNIYKVICTHATIAHWLCCTLKDQAVTLQDSIANISFKSSFHQPMAKDWGDHTFFVIFC
jgi:hypothetical protein